MNLARKVQTLNLLLLITALIIGSNIQANDRSIFSETDVLLRVYGSVIDNDNNLKMDECVVKVMQNGKFIEFYFTNSRGRYDFLLPSGHNYSFHYEKPGYVSKSIVIDSKEAMNMDDQFVYILKADIALFPELDGVDYSALNDPIGKGYCDEVSGSVVFDEAYTKQMTEKMAKLYTPNTDENRINLLVDIINNSPSDIPSPAYVYNETPVVEEEPGATEELSLKPVGGTTIKIDEITDEEIAEVINKSETTEEVKSVAVEDATENAPDTSETVETPITDAVEDVVVEETVEEVATPATESTIDVEPVIAEEPAIEIEETVVEETKEVVETKKETIEDKVAEQIPADESMEAVNTDKIDPIVVEDVIVGETTVETVVIIDDAEAEIVETKNIEPAVKEVEEVEMVEMVEEVVEESAPEEVEKAEPVAEAKVVTPKPAAAPKTPKPNTSPRPENVSNADNQNIVWRVQLGAYSNKNVADFYGVSNLDFITGDDGITRCVAGIFDTPKEAAMHKLELIDRGYKGAFIIAFKNDKRIDIKKTGADLKQVSYTKLRGEMSTR